jgi:DNA-binding response OmpR family regulator
VRSVLRRSESVAAAAADPVLVDGDLVVDTVARTVVLRGAEISLTTREFDLLAHVMSQPGRALRREDLMRDVWGWEFGDQSTVTVHVRRVREKIELDPADPQRLVTVWGIGYRWDPAPESTGAAVAETYRGDA